jgi:putative protease
VHSYKARLIPDARRPQGAESRLTVHCDTLGKVHAALQVGAERVLFGGDCFNHRLPSPDDYRRVAEQCRKAGREFAFATPRIVKEAQLGYFAKLFELWQELEPTCVYINNNGLWPLAKQYAGLRLVADMSLNIFNSQSLRFWQEQGAVQAVLSPELTMAQVEHLASVSPVPLECMIQGRLEMMVSEYCVGGSFLGELHKGACRFNCGEQLYLGDRKDARFPIATDQFCRMHILNAHDLSLIANVRQLSEAGVRGLRIDGRFYDESRLAELITLYRRVLGGAVENPENLPGTTRGHYYRGVL